MMLTEDERRRIQAEIQAARAVLTEPPRQRALGGPPGGAEAVPGDIVIVTSRSNAWLRSALEAYFQAVPGISVIQDRRVAERRGPHRWRPRERRRQQRRRPPGPRGFVGVVRWREP